MKNTPVDKHYGSKCVSVLQLFKMAEHSLIFHSFGQQLMSDVHSYGHITGVLLMGNFITRFLLMSECCNGLPLRPGISVQCICICVRRVCCNCIVLEFSSNMVDRDNSQKHLKSNHSKLQRMTNNAKRKQIQANLL